MTAFLLMLVAGLVMWFFDYRLGVVDTIILCFWIFHWQATKRQEAQAAQNERMITALAALKLVDPIQAAREAEDREVGDFDWGGYGNEANWRLIVEHIRQRYPSLKQRWPGDGLVPKPKHWDRIETEWQARPAADPELGSRIKPSPLPQPTPSLKALPPPLACGCQPLGSGNGSILCATHLYGTPPLPCGCLSRGLGKGTALCEEHLRYEEMDWLAEEAADDAKANLASEDCESR